MTWSTFIIHLSLSYIAYYTANLLYDLRRSRRNTWNERNSPELFYHENAAPFVVQYEEQQPPDQQDATNVTTAGNSGPTSNANTIDLKTITAQAKSDLQDLSKTI